MPLALACASHTPLIYTGPSSPETETRVRVAFETLGSFVKNYKPDVIVQFSSDHFNGFFYDMMPPFCVGAGAESLGDWGGGVGPLDVPEELSLSLIEHLRAEDFDVAVSYKMLVDHGFVQMWEAMLGDFRSTPIVPIFINAIAPPIPTYRRVRQLGESVGRFAAKSGLRVLLAASGGLSHDPPVPSIKDAPPEVRARLINGRNPSPEDRKAREERVTEAGALAEAGKGPCRPLNPSWDKEFLHMLASGQVSRADALNTERVQVEAGRGANEVLCWVAAFAAFATGGPFKVEQQFYEAIPGWIAGMAMVAATQDGAPIQRSPVIA